MRAKNTISIGRNSPRFIKCFRLSANDTHERERERRRKKEIQGLQHPLSPASKRRQKGPYRIPAETGGQALLACVNRNPYLCLSSTSTSVTPRHGGPRRGNRTREKEREGRERGAGQGQEFSSTDTLCATSAWVLAADAACLHPPIFFEDCALKTYDIAFQSRVNESSLFTREKRMLNVYAQVVPFSRGPKFRSYMNFGQFLFFLFSSREIGSILRDKSFFLFLVFCLCRCIYSVYLITNNSNF